MPSVRSAASERCTPAEPFTGNIDKGNIVYYRASKSDCLHCPLKPKCATATVRKITRDMRDRVGALADMEAFYRSRRERKKVEMRFAHMKRILGLDCFRLRGSSSRWVAAEFPLRRQLSILDLITTDIDTHLPEDALVAMGPRL
jgi:DDE family transposase